MKAGVRQLLGLAVAIVSFVGIIIICALPQWRVTKTSDYLSSEGLWKFCRTFTSSNQCRAYDSERDSITDDLAGARALIVLAIIVGVIGILLGLAGSKFINFVPDESKKRKMTLASGVVFLIAGFFVLISVCWITNTISGNSEKVPVRDFQKRELEASVYNDQSTSTVNGKLDSPKRKVGASVYIGWFTTGLLFLGGGLLCSSVLRRDGTD